VADPPLVSIITPSLNSGDFIEDTIRSVLNQDYPRIEYRVVDGGSTDTTLSILDRYGHSLRFESRRDAGPADALARGLAQAKGEILAYLNADDMYLSGAVAKAIQAFERFPDAAVIYGDADWIDEFGSFIAPYPTRDFDAKALARECFICQPAAFLRRSAYEEVGGMDPSLAYTFDYDLWLRLARRYRFVHLRAKLAQSRMHKRNLSLHSRRRVFRETIQTVSANTGYAGFGHVYAYACHLVDKRDQFFEPLKPSVVKYLLAVLLGAIFNGLNCGPFLREAAQAANFGWKRRPQDFILP
jgi:glycosyltransferase involved in cell wall biosynthesis